MIVWSVFILNMTVENITATAVICVEKLGTGATLTLSTFAKKAKATAIVRFGRNTHKSYQVLRQVIVITLIITCLNLKLNYRKKCNEVSKNN